MGRSKRTPVRLTTSKQNDNGLLGRRSVSSQASSAELLAAEMIRLQSSSSSQQHDDDEEEEELFVSKKKAAVAPRSRKKKKKRRIIQDDSDDEPDGGGCDDRSAVNHQDISTTSTKKCVRKNARGKKKKCVHFAFDDNEKKLPTARTTTTRKTSNSHPTKPTASAVDESSSLPRAITIQQETDNRLVIRYQHHQNDYASPVAVGIQEPKDAFSSSVCWELGRFALLSANGTNVSLVELWDDEKEDRKLPSSSWVLPITNPLDAQTMWKVAFPNHDEQHGVDHGEVVSDCLGAGTLRLNLLWDENQRNAASNNDDDDGMIHSPSWFLQLVLTDKAFHVCHADQFPLTASTGRFSKKKYHATHQLHQVLVLVFPESLLSDVWTSLSQRNPQHDQQPEQQTSPRRGRRCYKKETAAPPVATAAITAKHVYECTDNRQLKAALSRQQQQSSDTTANASQNGNDRPSFLDGTKIEGLRPTLRPYQEAAVAWMLAREQTPVVPTPEWMLAWVVLLPETGKCVPLYEWDSQQGTTTTRGQALFVCPFGGWLARSMHEAQSMMGFVDQPVRGGILAESMGLGKTVEVLACILAHPRPLSGLLGGAKRRLSFSDDVDHSLLAAQTVVEEESTTLGPTVGVVEDLQALGDSEVSSDEEKGEREAAAAEDRLNGAGSTDVAPTASISTAAVPVTPDKSTEDESAEERWLEVGDSLGSCICGNVIGLDDLKQKPVVICISCEEPMHLDCTEFVTRDDMEKATTPLVYKRMFSTSQWACRLSRDESTCPCCFAEKKQPIESRATLIVTPPAILSQWEREIQCHTTGKDGRPLRVAIYDGVEKISKSYGHKKGDGDVASQMKVLHPRILGDSDIVLMTFNALMADLGHSDDNRFISGDSGSTLRKRKRYRVVPSPLTSIKWWRVCLDEAQRVETPTAASAQMALKLEAEHRWCVSGTPVGRGKLEDLYGLLLFLRMDPFAYRLFFSKCLNPSHRDVSRRIQFLLQYVFWRSTKAYDLVQEQMGVPEQVDNKVTLHFSSIEKHFYDRQREETLLTAGDVVDRERSGKKRQAKQLNLLAEHLHSLRAACCHPQVGSSGIGKAKKHRHTVHRRHGYETDAGDGSRIMTMDEILVRFIEDAKVKCEESQRLAVLHTNGMAAVSKLKVEARGRGNRIKESDTALLIQSCKLYLDSLEIGEANAKPVIALGDAVLNGSTGFFSSRKVMKDGCSLLDWKLVGSDQKPVWSRIDFEGPPRKLTQIRVRPTNELPVRVLTETSDDFIWRCLYPKTCIIQVASAAVGGEFVDVIEFTCPPPDDVSRDSWVVAHGFRTNKSKSWRLLIKDYHQGNVPIHPPSGQYVGIEIELREADIASDSLQRLHCLHNASLSFTSLLQLHESGKTEDAGLVPSFLTCTEMAEKIETMKSEANKIELLYMDLARSLHVECCRRLEEASSARQKVEEELFDVSRRATRSSSDFADCWDDEWWDDFLVMGHLYGNEEQQRAICDRVVEDLDRIQGGPERGLIRFPPFEDIHGLRIALQSRVSGIRSGIGKPTAWIGTMDQEIPIYQFREDRFKCTRGMFAKCMESIRDFSTEPSGQEIWENGHCKVCKKNWNQQGPKCRQCLIGDQLNELEPDRVTLLLINSIHSVLKSSVGCTILQAADDSVRLEERASKFFDVMERQKREKVLAWRHWRTHLDLLNDLDELNQCKTSMRLVQEGEDMSALTDDELNAVVLPCDLMFRYNDHAAKQAMALGDLRRAKDTLRFLRNQSAERNEEGAKAEGDDEGSCMICLRPFETENRAVLRCGHSFHASPCIEQWQSKSGGNSEIRCPLRCKVRTRREDVMIASNKRRDDGSRSKRSIQGSWGTKVTRIVVDLLDVRDMGEKAVLFSQWEDMLDIVEQALAMNGVKYVRARSLNKIGEATMLFRVPDCTVLLLNVKNGAEGLTLVEATHVFMVEPLLNHGLDSQAVNRIHRIGQANKTYVHRYLMEGTVEIKIDALRMEHQEDILEDTLVAAKKTAIQAGGIDGGFRSETELMDLLSTEGA